MLLRLQKFNLNVVYKKGAEMYLADTLSRGHFPEVHPPGSWLQPDYEEVCGVDFEQVNAAEFLRISRDGLQNIQRLTEKDKLLQGFNTTVLRGWPEAKWNTKTIVMKLVFTMTYCARWTGSLYQLIFVER